MTRVTDERERRALARIKAGHRRNLNLFKIIIGIESGEHSMPKAPYVFVAGYSNQILTLILDLDYHLWQGARLRNGATFWFVRPKQVIQTVTDE